MNPIILYPKNAAQAKYFRETAEKKDVEMIRIPKKTMEKIEDWFLGAKMYERSKSAKVVSEKKMMALFKRKLRGK